MVFLLTRMHSSRMRTVRCNGCREGGGLCIPACTEWGCISACTAQGVSAGGCLLGGLPGGGGVRHTPPVDKMTDACENITLPQLPFGR